MPTRFRNLRAISPLAFLLPLVAGFPATPAAAQVISGTVLDAEAEAPLPAVDVLLRNAMGNLVDRTISDPDGRFWFQGETQGLYRIGVSRIGYDSTATVEVALGRDQNVHVEVRVRPAAVGMDPITVTAARQLPYLDAQGFYHRKRRGFGTFLGPEELSRVSGWRPTQMLRRVAGVQVLHDGRIRMRGSGSMSLDCFPPVYLDGIRLRGEKIDDLISLEMVDGIEIHRGAATIPARWRNNATCGVIAIWTKR